MAKAKKTQSPPGPDLSTVSAPVAPAHRHKDDEHEIEYLNLSDIFSSPTNPRKHFDAPQIAELADSINRYGVIQAITVRNKKGMGGKYEIVCGERRWLASKEAGRTTI